MTEEREKSGPIVRKHRKCGLTFSGTSYARPRRSHRDSHGGIETPPNLALEWTWPSSLASELQ